jgi:hypothetical protein
VCFWYMNMAILIIMCNCLLTYSTHTYALVVGVFFLCCMFFPCTCICSFCSLCSFCSFKLFRINILPLDLDGLILGTFTLVVVLGAWCLVLFQLVCLWTDEPVWSAASCNCLTW